MRLDGIMKERKGRNKKLIDLKIGGFFHNWNFGSLLLFVLLKKFK